MAWIADSLRSAIASVNPFQQRAQAPLDRVLTPELGLAAYLASGMMRKVINVPAEDRVREWRDWQAEKEQIEKIEAEEKRLQIIAKVRFAEVLRGIGGGALILAAPGDPGMPINAQAIGEKGLQAINVVSRWQLQAIDFIDELTDPQFGMPRAFKVAGKGDLARIHPSRVICFRGDPLPVAAGISSEDAFWGDSRLLRVVNEVGKSDDASRWFAELVKKAKLLRVGIPNLTDFTATSQGQQKLSSRVALIAEGESALNAVVYDAGNGKDSDSGGEKITDYQITWAGIPAMMDAFDQRVAAVADIPFTRLMGRSPAGMNSTGEHDMDNWNRAVVSGQKLELRPCLEQFDEVLIRSAGVDPKDITWRFAPLDTPSEKDEADTFDTTMDAVTKLQNTGAIPEQAFAKGVQNLMSEREWMPGLDQALAELPEDVRFGLLPDLNGDDPSALTEGGDPAVLPEGGVRGSTQPVRRAANDARFNDATPRTLYVSRKLLNGDEFIRWAKGQGFETVLPADQLHVTIAYSRQVVDWMKIGGDDWGQEKDGTLVVAPGGVRLVDRLGPEGKSAVLMFASDKLSWRHRQMLDAGASWDWPEYQPHVTITNGARADLDVAKINAFQGELRFGPELFAEVDENWKQGVTEE